MPTSVSYLLSLPAPPVSDVVDVDTPASVLDALGNGVVFPLERKSSDFATKSGADLVLAALKQIIRTKAAIGTEPGECLWDMDFGWQGHAELHSNYDPTSKDAMRIYLSRAIQRYEPRIDLLDLNLFARDVNGGRAVFLRVIYALRTDDDGFGGVVTPQELLVEIQPDV